MPVTMMWCMHVNLHAPYYKHSGTDDDTTQSTICSELSLKAKSCKLFISPNRPNIRVSVNKARKEGMESQLDWLVVLTKQQLEKNPKTIIFCNTPKDVTSVVNLLLLKNGEHAYVPVGSRNVEDLVIGIFHSVSWPKKQTEFCLQTKNRIVVASTALSMGVNFGDIRHVINWGPARNLLDGLREAGRAGCNKLRAHIIIVYHGQQLSQCEQEIKDFVKSEGCYRVAMYRPFDKISNLRVLVMNSVLTVLWSVVEGVVLRNCPLRKVNQQVNLCQHKQDQSPMKTSHV